MYNTVPLFKYYVRFVLFAPSKKKKHCRPDLVHLFVRLIITTCIALIRTGRTSTNK